MCAKNRALNLQDITIKQCGDWGESLYGVTQIMTEQKTCKSVVGLQNRFSVKLDRGDHKYGA